MVKETQTQDDVEATIFLRAQIADIVLDEFQIVELQHLFGKPGLLDVGLAPFDAHAARFAAGKLDRIQAFETREVEDAETLHRPADEIEDTLDDASELDLVTDN